MYPMLYTCCKVSADMWKVQICSNLFKLIPTGATGKDDLYSGFECTLNFLNVLASDKVMDTLIRGTTVKVFCLAKLEMKSILYLE